MLLKIERVDLRIRFQDFHKAIIELQGATGRFLCENRAKGHVENFAGVELLEQGWPV
jgi:hypothetical protein